MRHKKGKAKYWIQKKKKNEYKTKAEPKQAATKRQRPLETAQRVACELNRYTINDTEPITCDTVPNLFLACSLDPHSDPLLPRTHLPKAPRATCTERERVYSCSMSVGGCVWVAACVGHVSGCHHQRQRQSERQPQQRNTRRYWLLGVAAEKNLQRRRIRKQNTNLENVGTLVRAANAAHQRNATTRDE